ncbi:sialoadhesin-like [Centroberyx affinis]|uniref:sialoadhesin-like n=1 Tax=Centroberyx affinis TaxID=166261 RepID=UPI003A5C2CC6
MDRRVCFCLLTLSLLGSVVAQEETSYHALGGKLVLEPDTSTVSKPINNILWKHGLNLVVEWLKDVSLDYYGQFRARTVLDTSTGQLVINDLATNDGGVYSVEFNNKLQSKKYKIIVISEVQKPTVSLRPLACTSSSTRCTLSCDGGSPEAEPITYSWRTDGGAWEESTQLKDITNDDKWHKIKKISCQMKNPVSEEMSESRDNLFWSAQDETSYHALGGKLVLEPDTSAVSKPITNTLWKHGLNLVVEWLKDVSLDYYGQFRDRTVLDTSTGQLVINDLATNDGGVYSVEFNNKLQSKKYKIIVISEVQKPTVSLQPLACTSSSTRCTLSCDGGSPEAEPITYSWRTDGGAWEESTQLKDITNDDKWHKIKKISCQMKNPISEEMSESRDNLFWSAQDETSYHALGGKLVLEPDTSAVSKPITNILWKHGLNLVVEWLKDSPVDYYGQFRDRTVLDTSTGQLVINDLVTNDGGVYSVEFNNKLQSKKYKIIVISEVQKPTMSLQPLACDSSSTRCTLSCDGGSPEAEPITYSWRTDGGAWEESTQLKDITNDDKWHKIKKISCQMKNPISEEESEPHDNIFWSAQDETSYHALGGKLVLEPDTSAVSKPITNILWKHGLNLVVEWLKDSPVDYYGQFRARTVLDTSTGQLVINDLATNDGGVYSVEFNNKLQSKKYKIIVISEVQKPMVLLRPLSCDSSLTDCTLGCDGGSPEAQPITYSWRTDGGAWEESTQLKDITNDHKWHNIEKISCQMKNPVSVEESEPLYNPFQKKMWW